MRLLTVASIPSVLSSPDQEGLWRRSWIIYFNGSIELIWHIQHLSHHLLHDHQHPHCDCERINKVQNENFNTRDRESHPNRWLGQRDWEDTDKTRRNTTQTETDTQTQTQEWWRHDRTLKLCKTQWHCACQRGCNYHNCLSKTGVPVSKVYFNRSVNWLSCARNLKKV